MEATKKEDTYWYQICYLLRGYLEYFTGNYQQAVHCYDLALLPKYNQSGSYQAELTYKTKVYRYLSLIQLGKEVNSKELLAIEIPPRDFITKQELNRVLSRYYVRQGNYQKALDYYTAFQAYSDSSDVLGQRGKVFESEQKYSVAQKEAAIAQLENKNLQAKAT